MILDSDKVKASEAGKTRLREAMKQAKLTQEELGQRAKVSVDTIKRLLGTKPAPNGVERWAVKNIAQLLNINPLDIVHHQDWNQHLQSPQEFEPLIKEKTRSFCGRGFVFTAFADFLKKYPKGYFTVIGDAGMGKSAIAAKYVYENKAICYFNVLQERNNRPELFLKSIRQQLTNRYQLENTENDELSALLIKASAKISDGENLVIVVDALDEVEQEPGAENILYLPKILPDKVYFLLTRRRYEPNKKRLYIEGVAHQELDLTASQYNKLSRDDIQAYITFILNNIPEYKDGLRNWIRKKNIADETFIEQVATKSENNFMYLRYVLPVIAKGDYNDLSLTQLPDGLQDYYQVHWGRMGMDAKPQEVKVFILFILVEIGTPITWKMIADIAKQDEDDVQSILDEWVEYLKQQDIKGEICHSIYHASFLDFLKAKRVLDSKRKLFEEVNQRIADYLMGKMA
ncbi:helix-turn-helix transcriptional regulator [Nostoc sp. ATCC 53789]|uniref:helix-turn-helix domain-containing protein n=1 Tax=Nostoc sp. ATCC 53789 TaxID=76335 RepID=UPI001C68E41C|nr:helix-turn-helix transcriptional regulator [Nostoc sp. ATCC 53789]